MEALDVDPRDNQGRKPEVSTEYPFPDYWNQKKPVWLASGSRFDGAHREKRPYRRNDFGIDSLSKRGSADLGEALDAEQ